MKAAVLISCLLFVPIVFLADCRGGKMATPPDSVSVRQIPAEAQHDVDLIVQGNTAFALDLYARVKDEPGNLLCSPYSISTALAMTYAGAQGDTATQMATALHFTLPAADLHAAFGAPDLQLGVGLGRGDVAAEIQPCQRADPIHALRIAELRDEGKLHV